MFSGNFHFQEKEGALEPGCCYLSFLLHAAQPAPRSPMHVGVTTAHSNMHAGAHANLSYLSQQQYAIHPDVISSRFLLATFSNQTPSCFIALVFLVIVGWVKVCPQNVQSLMLSPVSDRCWGQGWLTRQRLAFVLGRWVDELSVLLAVYRPQ